MSDVPLFLGPCGATPEPRKGLVHLKELVQILNFEEF